MPTGSAPITAAIWVALLLMTGFLLYAGRPVLVPLALSVLIWQLINAVSVRLERLEVAGYTPRRWHQLVGAIVVIVLALWLAVNLIVRNVGTVSANASVYEANLPGLLPRIAGLFGLPAPESMSDLMDQVQLDVLIRSISAALAGFVGSIGLVALYVALSGDFSATYGPLAGIMALLLWATATGVALLFGLAVAAQLEGARAGIGDPLLADADADGIPDQLEPGTSRPTA